MTFSIAGLCRGTGQFGCALTTSSMAAGAGAVAVGNGLASAEVPAAMLRGFEAAPEKDLAERLIMALEYGLEAGGEAFPLRSASLHVAHVGVPFPPVNLRVDFNDTPIAE